MSCNAAIYTVNNTPTAILAAGTVPLGTVIRRFGCALQLSGDGITIGAPGYYDVDVNLTVQPTAAGPVTATLFKDGVAVPGAIATSTAAAAGDSVNLNISALVRQAGCCAGLSTLTVQLSAAATITNAAIVVEKV